MITVQKRMKKGSERFLRKYTIIVNYNQIFVIYINCIFSDSIIILKEEYQLLHAGGSLVLAQEQDAKAIFSEAIFNPKFDAKQGFSGLLTQVELWNIVLSKEEIQKLANCELVSLRSQRRVITWDSDAWLAKKTNFTDVPLGKLCEQNLIMNQFVWPKAIDFNTFNNYCSTVNGR